MSFAREEGNAVLLTLFFRSLKKKGGSRFGLHLEEALYWQQGFQIRRWCDFHKLAWNKQQAVWRASSPS